VTTLVGTTVVPLVVGGCVGVDDRPVGAIVSETVDDGVVVVPSVVVVPVGVVRVVVVVPTSTQAMIPTVT
jgi:hypothetical protein